MGRLVVVYGMDDELEVALGRLESAGLGGSARVVQGAPEDRGHLEDPEERVPEVVAPPAATLVAGVPVGAPAAVSPYAAEAVEAAGGAGWTRRELEDLTGARDEEARHLLDVVAGGGSLLVVEGDARVLDAAERALAGHTGQGAVRR